MHDNGQEKPACGRPRSKERALPPAKVAAARHAAQFAGRKPKFQVGDRARAKNQAPVDYRRREGFVTEKGLGNLSIGSSLTIRSSHHRILDVLV
jgi:hypothetical protein